MDVFLGTIMPFPYGFAPLNWLPCNGQLLPIRQYAPLYSLIGTYYGGDGTTTFALPNLNSSVSRVAAGQGTAPGLTPRIVGEAIGEDAHVLTTSEMPGHNHSMTLYSGVSAKTPIPTAGATLVDPIFTGFLPPGTKPATTLNPATVGFNGGGQNHPNDQPTLQLNYCIAMTGIFPTFG